MRLDKFLSSVTDHSRSAARQLIRDGAVAIAGVVSRDPACAVDAAADVTLHGHALRPPAARYFMLNKPVGYVCATRDRQHPTVLELLDEDNVETLHIAGRLDIDTTGLVLISDDGRWCHQVTSPRRACLKTYRVETAEPIAPETASQFERGLWLHNEKRRLQPAQLEQLGPRQARLSIGEGRYHQVKRMFAAVGNAVTRLHRETVGGIALDPILAEGAYRPLQPLEIAAVVPLGRTTRDGRFPPADLSCPASPPS